MSALILLAVFTTSGTMMLLFLAALQNISAEVEEAAVVDGTTGWAKVSSTAVRDGDGGFLYAVRVVEDISDRKRAEARQKLLVDELNHRVKNTLMTVQSLAFQTFRQGLPPEMARERFEARLISLSRTHNLLNESHWQGARLGDILTLELDPYTSDGKDRLAASGPNLELPARTAVVLGMVFHELATNAVKYGCFSVPEGRLEVRWRVTPSEADPETLARMDIPTGETCVEIPDRMLQFFEEGRASDQ